MKYGIMLIGCGGMASVHCDQIRQLDSVRLVSAVDLDAEKAEAFQNQFRFDRAATDYRVELEKPDIQIVLVATTWQPRHEIVMNCLDAGKHVLAEKPLSLYLDEIDAMFSKAKEKNLKLRVGHNMRFRPLIQKATELIHNGAIGNPLAYNFIHHQAGPKSLEEPIKKLYANLLQKGVTPNVDCGIHYCDFVRQWSRADATQVYSVGQNLGDGFEGDNWTHSVFDMGDGATLTIENCYSLRTRPFVRMAHYGNKGRILMEYAKSGTGHHSATEEDRLTLWQAEEGRTQTFDLPLGIKSTGPQMLGLIKEIETNADQSAHYDDVRKSTEMVAGSVLSEKRHEAVKFPLTDADLTDIRKTISK